VPAAPAGAAPQAAGGGIAAALLALPKPILFGLFGAAGGFVGALILGELLWFLLRPSGVKAVVPQVQAAVPDSVRAYAGGKNRFLVKIARQAFTGAVTVQTTSPSPQVTVPVALVGPDADQTEVEVQVAADAPVGSVPLSLAVASADEKTVAEATASVTLTVEPLPPTLDLAVPGEVEVEQGGRGRFTVRIGRARFEDSVALKFRGLPPGIDLPERIVPARESSVTLEVNAPLDAPVGPSAVTVQAVGLIDRGRQPTAEATFNLAVRERSPPTVDVLFVLDLTGSMQFAIDGIKRGVQSFVEQLGNQKLDARIGMVCFRDIEDDKERPFTLDFTGEAFTKDYRAFRDKVKVLTASGGGDTPESSLQGLALAARQKFRRNAARVLILITDAPPKIHKGETPSTVAEAIEELKRHEIDQVHLVIQKEDLAGAFGPLQKEFKGSFFNIKESTKGTAFADLLPALSRDISRLTIASGPRGTGKPSEPPPLPEARTASLPPPPPEVPVLKAVQSTQAFAAADRFQLLVATMAWTMTVAACISLLLLAGQQLHARQSWVEVSEGSWAVLGGALAGLAGGAVGQLVFQGTSGAAGWEQASRVLGWSFLGGLVGAVMAFFVPNLKWYRGALGGLLGGVLGAVAFLLVSLALGALLGRWLGAAILGFCLGLMVALAELAFRRYWLEIAVSPREVRTVTLGTTAVTLGSDEKRSSYFVSGAAPVALRYWLAGEAVCCEDVTAGQTMVVPPGESRQVGRVTVTLRSVAASRRTGYVLALAGGRSIALLDGMPLTAEDLPGLEPKGSDGMVAIVSAQPGRAQEVLLRNRSRQSWTMHDAAGRPQAIDPGRGVELAPGVAVDFGQVRGTIQVEERRG
jgi:Ca-activated chloride channel family protein